MSPPRLPQAVQTKPDSMSDSRTWSGQRSALISTEWLASVVAAIDQHLTDAGFAQLADGEFGWG
jgi:hypothetical protein